jgi:hypothetical protein
VGLPTGSTFLYSYTIHALIVSNQYWTFQIDIGILYGKPPLTSIIYITFLSVSLFVDIIILHKSDFVNTYFLDGIRLNAYMNGEGDKLPQI